MIKQEKNEYDLFCEQYPQAAAEYEEWRLQNLDADEKVHIENIERIREKHGVNGPHYSWNPATRPLKK